MENEELAEWLTTFIDNVVDGINPMIGSMTGFAFTYYPPGDDRSEMWDPEEHVVILSPGVGEVVGGPRDGGQFPGECSLVCLRTVMAAFDKCTEAYYVAEDDDEEERHLLFAGEVGPHKLRVYIFDTPEEGQEANLLIDHDGPTFRYRREPGGK